MTAKHQIIASLVFGVTIGLGVVFLFFQSPEVTHQQTTDQVGSTLSPVLPSPSPSTDTSWSSPDGKKILSMKADPIGLDTVKYSFSVVSSASPSAQLIYTKTQPVSVLMSIPFNTWSPANQYFFIQENQADATHNYVFKANGLPFPDGQPLLDINTLFEAKKSGFILREVTGWAAPTLLIINTETADLKTGPSFWFDITRNSLTRLSTTFP